MKLKLIISCLLVLFLIINSSIFAAESEIKTMKEGYVNVSGGKIWYQIHTTKAAKDKTPIILLHGGPGVPHNYLLNLSKLSEQRPVIFYDQLGCGKSSLQGEHKHLWTLDRFVGELDALTKALDISQFHLLGQSWGGSLAIEYTLAHPEKVKSLILASPVLSAPLWAKETKRLLRQLPQHVQDNIEKHEQLGTTDSTEYQDAMKLYSKMFLCRMESKSKDLQYSLDHVNHEIYFTMWGPSEFTVTGNLKNFDRINDISKLSMPILITCGRYDEATPESMEIARKKSNNARLVIFEKSAHVSHLEEQEAYFATLVGFLTEVENRA